MADMNMGVSNSLTEMFSKKHMHSVSPVIINGDGYLETYTLETNIPCHHIEMAFSEWFIEQGQTIGKRKTVHLLEDEDIERD